MTQTIAILHDSLRHLRSQYLFWISLAISVLVALLLFGLISFTPEGWRVLWMPVNESDVLREGGFGARQLLTWLFGGAFVFWWLSWGAVILALIATAGIMPDFLAGGSIDLAVSKPISRVKLFLAKVLGALLFMLLLVTVGVFAAYLLMGLRFGMWFHAALWAIPLLVLQFLYLYTVLALTGVITRSALAALIATFVFWVVIFVIQFAANQIDGQMAGMQAGIERSEQRIADVRDAAAEEQRDLTSWEESRIRRWESQVESQKEALQRVAPWQRRASTLRLLVPKTGDVQKIIAELVEAPTFAELILALEGFDEDFIAATAGMDDPQEFQDMQEADVAGARAMRDVATWQSIGSSLIFTAIVLGLATLIFHRRDF